MVELSCDAGWNQSPETIQDIISRSGKYILGAFCGEKQVGVAAAYCYPDIQMAFINEVIVKSEFRKRGIATSLLQELLPMVRPICPTMRLYATEFGRPIYEKLGFIPYGTLCFCQFNQALARPSARVINVSEEDLPALYDLDARQFGARREQLIDKLFQDAPSSAWCIKAHGNLEGFILRSPSCWLLQSQTQQEIAELVLHANYNLGASHMACLWQEDANAFAKMSECPRKLTAMQLGTFLPYPDQNHSGCLPDIG